MVDDVVGSVAHTKQGAGRMEVTWHTCPHIHIFPDALGANTCINKLNVQDPGSCSVPVSMFAL